MQLLESTIEKITCWRNGVDTCLLHLWTI